MRIDTFLSTMSSLHKFIDNVSLVLLFFGCIFIRHSHQLFVIGLLQIFLAGCQRLDISQGIIKIAPSQPLIVESGKTVNWRFIGEKGGRRLKIVSVKHDRLPIGVTINFKNEDFVISGNAIPSIVSEGNIYVTAFDEEACKQSVVAGLGYFDRALAFFNFKVRGKNSLCSYNLHRENLFFTKSAVFPWFSAQYSSIWGQPIKSFMDGVAESSLKMPVFGVALPSNSISDPSLPMSGVFLIPHNEAPHQGLSYLDACYVYAYDQCGINSDCVWHSGACASLSTNSLKQIGN